MYTPEDQQRIDASIAYFLADVGELPAGVADALPLFVWDTDRLRTYPAPVQNVELARLQRFLAAPVWRREGGASFTLSPAEVANRPHLHPRAHARALAVDLRYPIDIICQHDGWHLTDGYHRLLKAYLLSLPTVLAHLVPAAAVPAILADLATLPPPRHATGAHKRD